MINQEQNPIDTDAVGLYIHIPFCVTKCNYCSFYSIPYNKVTADLYKSAVIRNINEYIKQGQIFDTVFFGGGTPSLLYREIAEISEILPTTANAEITTEVNPCDITSEMLDVLINAGVNRLSIGVQSLDNVLLQSLGRRHDSKGALNSVEFANQAGFDNISVDIMIGIPGQILDNLCDTINRVTALPITHVSAYIYEPLIQGSADIIIEETVSEMYLKTVELLEDKGFCQYEISNFGLPCRHNLKYWNCENYIGIGAAAHSYYNSIYGWSNLCGGCKSRFAVKEDVDVFINSALQKTYVTEENPRSFEERVMLKLRLTQGICQSDCESYEWKVLQKRANSIPKEYIMTENGRVSLTTKGFLIANRIIGELLYS